jgi:hypothetical protein
VLITLAEPPRCRHHRADRRQPSPSRSRLAPGPSHLPPASRRDEGRTQWYLPVTEVAVPASARRARPSALVQPGRAARLRR